MAKINIKGIGKDGIFDAEVKRTAVLVTELIYDFPRMCEHDIFKALCEIRESAERDDRVRRIAMEAARKNVGK